MRSSTGSVARGALGVWPRPGHWSRSRCLLDRSCPVHTQYDCVRPYSDRSTPEKSDDAPVWRPSRREIVVNDLEATLEAHRNAIKDIRRNLESEDKSDLPQIEDGGQHPNLDARAARDRHTKSVDNGDGHEVQDQTELGQDQSVQEPDDRAVKWTKVMSKKRPKFPLRPYMDKRGAVIEIQRPWQKPWGFQYRGRYPHLYRPWMSDINHNNILNKSSMAVLEIELHNFGQMMKFKDAEKEGVQRTIASMSSIIRDTLPQSTLRLQGSHATGLATILSDIDIVVSTPELDHLRYTTEPSPHTHPKVQRASKTALKQLQTALENTGDWEAIEYVAAKLPLLSVLHKASGLKFQLIAAAEMGPALEYTNYYLQEYPEMRPLHQALHQTLRMRNLNKSTTGGIGGYTLFIMILTVLKFNPTPPAAYPLATRLLQFLDFWSTADSVHNGYAADPALIYPKSARDAEQILKESKDPSTSFETTAETPAEPIAAESTLPDSTTSETVDETLNDPTAIETATTEFDTTESDATDSTDPSPSLFAKLDPHTQNMVEGLAALTRLNVRSRKRDSYPPWQLCLQDPAAAYNDLGKRTNRFNSVQATLRSMRAAMAERMREWDDAALVGDGENSNANKENEESSSGVSKPVGSSIAGHNSISSSSSSSPYIKARAQMQSMLDPLLGGKWLRFLDARRLLVMSTGRGPERPPGLQEREQRRKAAEREWREKRAQLLMNKAGKPQEQKEEESAVFGLYGAVKEESLKQAEVDEESKGEEPGPVPGLVQDRIHPGPKRKTRKPRAPPPLQPGDMSEGKE